MMHDDHISNRLHLNLGPGTVRKVRNAAYRREILTLSIRTSTSMHQKNEEFFGRPGHDA